MSIEAMKQALKAIDIMKIHYTKNRLVNDAIESLQKAIQEEALQNVQQLGQEIEAEPTNCRHCGGADNVICAGQCKQAKEQEPVAVDKTIMELAESVGLIGPASRSNDLHEAIQRFHDLICVNATIKAAQMAADVIQDTSPPKHEPCPFVVSTKEGTHHCALSHREPLTDEEIDTLLLKHGVMNQWPTQKQVHAFARAIEAAHGIKGEA